MTISITTPSTADLEAALLTNPALLARVVARAITTAGAQTDWDSSTIEEVLQPLTWYGAQVGVPQVGNYRDPEARYWARIADAYGIEHDQGDDDLDPDETGEDDAYVEVTR